MYVAGRFTTYAKTGNVDIEGSVNVHRTDLTFSYKMEVVGLPMNWINKDGEDKFDLKKCH